MIRKDRRSLGGNAGFDIAGSLETGLVSFFDGGPVPG